MSCAAAAQAESMLDTILAAIQSQKPGEEIVLGFDVHRLHEGDERKLIDELILHFSEECPDAVTCCSQFIGSEGSLGGESKLRTSG